ncbi:CRISPR-associated endonuclease Cas1 [Aurantiacibacter rhizosphaerae]|uniref:CRISPR-associated endonuclease Cas1 n=1 Tax=Aurantiacibacter rhizosphaerae TaxID=2691582 RepID=A0A844XCC0_9SPHN|nr:CRISPR-associated endonuclease Cas1 [Aurantiacibacter rhizosphaerae]MWV28077.1 CRISPR-associated endonuclease Cas1 [Aurantiacibacter rhizosphaerae]
MLETSQFRAIENHSEWAERSEFWVRNIAKSKRKRRRRERTSQPLILTGHGSSLRIEQGSLLIRQGFSHYPQKAEQFRYFKGDLQLPRLILLLDGSGSISFDVLGWLGEQGVALARVQWSGDPVVYASGAGFIGNPENLQWQYKTQSDEQLRLEFARTLICDKVRNSLTTLRKHVPDSSYREKAIAKANETLVNLPKRQFGEMNELRNVEAECAARYFAAWKAVELRWKAESRYPIPDTWRKYQARSSILTGRKARNWKASHPINAMLNYAYTVRLAQLQVQAVSDGYDPFGGIMHHYRREIPAFAYDLIEPERPKVDAAVLAFARKQTFSGADFILRKDGVCRLSPQLARNLAGLI